MKTQREFIKAVAKQTIQLKNITKIGGLIDVVKKNVKTNKRKLPCAKLSLNIFLYCLYYIFEIYKY